MSDDSASTRFDRRQFTKQLAALSSAATTLLSTTPVIAAAANNPAAGQDNKPADAAQPNPENAEEQRDRTARPPEELLLLNFLIQRYPSERFDDVAMRGIYNDLRSDLARSRILSDFPLKNSDEPNYIFRAYRGPE